MPDLIFSFVKPLPMHSHVCVWRVPPELNPKQNNNITLGDVYQTNYVVSMTTPSQEKLPDFIRGKEKVGQCNSVSYILSVFKSFSTPGSLYFSFRIYEVIYLLPSFCVSFFVY
jgi:hypothetical protein